jgi:glycosyltransferase involved in cell wall biosynthesis
MSIMKTLPSPLSAHRQSSASAVLYVLHSAELFGTERMAIATLAGLGARFESLLLSPPGPSIAYAQAHAVAARPFCGHWQLLREMAAVFRARPALTLVATGVTHSLAGVLLALWYGVRLHHVHVVHGGAEERLSYGRKKWLRRFDVEFIAVSAFVRERLLAHGLPGRRVRVIENFLSESLRPQHPPFCAPLVRAIVVSRLDPIKRVGLLLDALEGELALAPLRVDVYGTGWEGAALKARALRTAPNVYFAGFSASVAAQMAAADLLIHTCPDEPFGLAVLEAMAAGIPVLVPDKGGPSGFIVDGENGFLYRANDGRHLAARLLEICSIGPQRINRIVAAARLTLAQRFAPEARIADYRLALTGSWP